MPLVQRTARHERLTWTLFGGGTLLLALLSRVGGTTPVAEAAASAQAVAVHDLAPAALRLRNGHLLAIQKAPPLLVELGPAGAAGRVGPSGHRGDRRGGPAARRRRHPRRLPAADRAPGGRPRPGRRPRRPRATRLGRGPGGAGVHRRPHRQGLGEPARAPLHG